MIGAVGEHLHPLAPAGVGVLLLVVFGAVHHQVVALKAVVVDDEIAVVHLPGVGGLGVIHPYKQAVVGVGALIALPVGALHQMVGGVKDERLTALLAIFSDAVATFICKPLFSSYNQRGD